MLIIKAQLHDASLYTLSPARWHDKHTYLSSLGMLGTTQLIFFFCCKSHNISQWIYETRPYKAENDK